MPRWSRSTRSRASTAAVGEITSSRVFLLGTGDSGKTTLLKQASYLLDESFSASFNGKEGAMWLDSLLQVTRTALNDNNITSPLEVQLFRDAKVAQLKHVGRDAFVSTFLEIWEDKNFELFLKQSIPRPELQYVHFRQRDFLLKSVKENTFNGKWSPTEEELIHWHIPSIGINNVRLKLPEASHMVSFYDFGGRMSERKKWPKTFNDIGIPQTVIFTVALGDIGCFLHERVNMSRFQDSLEAFKYFMKTVGLKEMQSNKNLQVKLLFTKVDLLKECIQSHPEHVQHSLADVPGFQSVAEIISKAEGAVNFDALFRSIGEKFLEQVVGLERGSSQFSVDFGNLLDVDVSKRVLTSVLQA